MSLSIFIASASALFSLTANLVALRSLIVARHQYRASSLQLINEQFDSPFQVIASNPRIRPLFYDDELARKIDKDTITAEDYQVAAMVAESLCDAFESALTADETVRADVHDDHFYGYFIDRMMSESEFLRDFIINRPAQYDGRLFAKATARHRMAHGANPSQPGNRSEG